MENITRRELFAANALSGLIGGLLNWINRTKVYGK